MWTDKAAEVGRASEEKGIRKKSKQDPSVCFAIHASKQLTFPTGVLSLKLPPPHCVVLLVERCRIWYIMKSMHNDMIWNWTDVCDVNIWCFCWWTSPIHSAQPVLDLQILRSSWEGGNWSRKQYTSQRQNEHQEKERNLQNCHQLYVHTIHHRTIRNIYVSKQIPHMDIE